MHVTIEMYRTEYLKNIENLKREQAKNYLFWNGKFKTENPQIMLEPSRMTVEHSSIVQYLKQTLETVISILKEKSITTCQVILYNVSKCLTWLSVCGGCYR